jgi:DNA repair protein RecO (recombination protein O)
VYTQTKSTLAIVLRSVDFRESDRVVTLLTEQFGKLGVIARGVRRSKRRFSGALEPFLLLDIQFRFGRGELAHLEQASVKTAFPGIIKSLTKIDLAGAALDLVRVGTPAQERDSTLFSTVVNLFQLLDTADRAFQELLLAFRVRLLTLLGFTPSFDSCGRCGRRPDENRAAFFDPRSGHLICRACGGAPIYLSASTRKLLICASSPDWHTILSGWTVEERKEANNAVSVFIKHHLDHELRRIDGEGELSR